MTDGPTPEQMAWDDWDARRRRRARLATGAWALLMLTLAMISIVGILPHLRLPASSADSNELLSAGMDAAMVLAGMFLVVLVARIAWMFLLEYLETSRVLLGERPEDRDAD